MALTTGMQVEIMFAGHSQRLLQAAAAETLHRIERDRERAPRRIKPLLAYIGEHLFDPSLDVNQLKRGCGVRDNSLPIQFHAALGRPPHAYIETCRLEIACRLLRGSDLKVWKIAELIGYSSIQVFSRAFTRWAGLRPTAYRKDPTIEVNAWGDSEESLLHTPSKALEPAPAGSVRAELTDLELALEGKLPPADVRPLVSRLVALYPLAVAEALRDQEPRTVDARRATFPKEARALDRLSFDESDLQKVRAEEVWAAIRNRSQDQQREFVRKEVRFSSPALFELLNEKSIELGRDNRDYGVELSQLALDSLDALDCSGEKRRQLLARGWAWLSRSRRLALDFRGAEKALAAAEEHLDSAPENERSKAEVLTAKAGLRWNQHRLGEALPAVNEALEIYQRNADDESYARALLLRGVMYDSTSQLELGVADFEEGIRLLEGHDDPYLLYSAYHSLAAMKLQLGELEELAQLLPTAQAIGRKAGLSEVRLRLRWLEGLVARELGRPGAEEALVETREGFIAVGRGAEAAASSLDLACYLFEQGRQQEVMELASEVIVLCDALDNRRDALAGIRLLRDATQANRLTQAILEGARSSLAEGSKAPHLPPRSAQA